MKHPPDDPLSKEALEELRRLPPTSPEAVEAVMARIRRVSLEEPAPARGTRRWMMAGIGAAAAAAAALVLVPRSAVLPVRPREEIDAARRVQFVYVAEGASDVSLLGTFNDWDPRAHPLGRVGRGGPWVTEITLPPGRYEYAYRVDGELRADESALRTDVDEYGSVSSVIVVEPTDRGALE
jgi:hypothetical protein